MFKTTTDVIRLSVTRRIKVMLKSKIFGKCDTNKYAVLYTGWRKSLDTKRIICSVVLGGTKMVRLTMTTTGWLT